MWYHDYEQYWTIQSIKRYKPINQEEHKIFTVETLEWEKNHVSTFRTKIMHYNPRFRRLQDSYNQNYQLHDLMIV